MAQTISNSIRIIPRDENFLNRNVGASGEIFYNRDENTLRLYDGNTRGGYTVASTANLSTITGTAGVASLEYTTTIDNNGVSNKYVFNNVSAPELQLVIGYTYVFDQSNQTNEYYPNPDGGVNNQHPLSFSETPNGELAFGAVYENNVKYQLDGKEVTQETYKGTKFASAADRRVFLLVTKDTPTTLYYYCTRHQNMGNSISVVEPGAGGGSSDASASIAVGENAPADPVVGNIWFNNSTGVLYIRSDDASGDEYWIQPSVPQTDAFTQFTVDTDTLAPTDSADEITFVAGSNVTITADAVANTIEIAATGGGGGGGGDVVSDTTPELGGDLDLNTSDITGTGNINITGAIAASTSVSAPSFVNTGVGGASVTSATTLSIAAPDGIVINGEIDLGVILKSSEKLNMKTSATGVVEHDYDTGAVWYHSSLSGNFTANLTNIPTDDNRVIVVTLLISQGGTPYLPTALQIDGAAQSILWLDATTPSGNGGQLDSVTFSLIRQSASWNVIGALTTFG